MAKPGMQRDILVAYWLLFDEFEIGEDELPNARDRDGEPAAPPDEHDPSPSGPSGRSRRES